MLRGIFIISQICELLFITESNNQSLHFLIYCMTFQGPWQHNVLTMALKYSYACDLPYRCTCGIKKTYFMWLFFVHGAPIGFTEPLKDVISVPQKFIQCSV